MCMVLRYGVLGSSRRLDLLHPAAHPRLIAQVFLAEDAFHVLLLALDLVVLDHVHTNGKNKVAHSAFLRAATPA